MHITLIDAVQEIVSQIGKKSFQDIVSNFDRELLNLSSHVTLLMPKHTGLPDVINRTYIDQANYWLTFFP